MLASVHENAYNYIYNYFLARKNQLINILSSDSQIVVSNVGEVKFKIAILNPHSTGRRFRYDSKLWSK